MAPAAVAEAEAARVEAHVGEAAGARPPGAPLAPRGGPPALTQPERQQAAAQVAARERASAWSHPQAERPADAAQHWAEAPL